jgi:hypothetical protein
MGHPTVSTNPSHKSINTLCTTNGTVLTANYGRRDGLVQNLAAEKLYVKKGAGCSATDFTVILSPCVAEDDGYGASLPLGNYSGVVSIFAISTTPRAMVSEDIG